MKPHGFWSHYRRRALDLLSDAGLAGKVFSHIWTLACGRSVRVSTAGLSVAVISWPAGVTGASLSSGIRPQANCIRA